MRYSLKIFSQQSETMNMNGALNEKLALKELRFSIAPKEWWLGPFSLCGIASRSTFWNNSSNRVTLVTNFIDVVKQETIEKMSNVQRLNEIPKCIPSCLICYRYGILLQKENHDSVRFGVGYRNLEASSSWSKQVLNLWCAHFDSEANF